MKTIIFSRATTITDKRDASWWLAVPLGRIRVMVTIYYMLLCVHLITLAVLVVPSL